MIEKRVQKFLSKIRLPLRNKTYGIHKKTAIFGIQSKILLPMLVTVILFSVLAGYFVYSLGNLQMQTKALEKAGYGVSQAYKLASLSRYRYILFNDFYIGKAPATKDKFKMEGEKFQQLLKDLREEKELNNPKVAELLNQLEGLDKQLTYQFEEKLIPGWWQIDPSQMASALSQAKFLRKQLIARSGELVKTFEQNRSTTVNSIENHVENILTVILIVSISAIILAMALAITVSRSISKPLVVMAELSRQVASGNLAQPTLKVKAKDETGVLGNSLISMVRNLRDIITDTRDTSEQVSGNSQQLAAVAEQTKGITRTVTETMAKLVEITVHQQSQSEQSLVTVNQVGANIEQITNNLQHVAEKSQQVTKLAFEGDKFVSLTSQQMTAINNSNANASAVVAELGRLSSGIGKAVFLIDTITEQTHMLSLNAAIEAARAGEYGRGFAVVAQEIRKLSEQSRTATTEISDKIRETQEKISIAITAMEEGTSEIAAGMQVVKQTNDIFKQINKAIQQSSQQLEETASAAQEIQLGTVEVINVIENLANMSGDIAQEAYQVKLANDEQATSVERISLPAEQLAETASHLLKQVNHFRLGE